MKRLLFLAFGAILTIIGCAHLPASDYSYGQPAGSSGPVPTPSGQTPSPGPTGTPGPCGTPDVTDPSVVYVNINPDEAPAKDPAGNNIFGYAPYDVTAGAIPGTSAVIDMSSTQRLQFVNTDANPNTVLHSAVGFTQNGFPNEPYAFPSGSDMPIGTAITKMPLSGAGSPWSTGEIAPGCASQVFTVSDGTFYFGDLNTYNTSASLRDEVIVTL